MLISQTDLPTNVTTLYTYDKAGRKIKVTNTKQKVEYQFRKSYNSNTDLNNYGFRDYSSSIGRFITQDPIRDGTNWYTLAVNNPINFVDLWGLCTANEKPKNVWENYTGAGNPYATQMINRDKSTSGTKNPYEGIKDENSYNIIPYYISEKSQNRQQTQIRTVKAIVIHWTAVPNQSPIDTIDYWNSNERIRSAQYVVSTGGGIFQAMPEEERARHAGNVDGVYKQKATELFGDGINPNAYSIGIEMEPINSDGQFSEETINATVSLTADLCERYNLNPYSEVVRHYDITGKECPKLYVNDESEWQNFLDAVKNAMEDNK